MGTRIFCAFVLCVCIYSVPASAVIVVDGNPSDWGVTVADGNGSIFNFTANVGSMVEDTSDTAGDTGDLGPHRGGQNFDAEAMGISIQNDTLFVLIVSGQRPDNGLARYNPGDLQITTNLGVYGMEMGGGVGGGAGTAITEGATGSTYAVGSTGFTTAHANADPLQTAGSIWTNVTWLNTPLAPPVPTQFAINGSSNFIGMADYFYTRDTVTSQHSIMELSIPLSLFSGANIQQISWRPACDNDELDVFNQTIPEPSSLLLLGLGFLPILYSRRK